MGAQWKFNIGRLGAVLLFVLGAMFRSSNALQPSWKVKDCMIMSFNATLEFELDGVAVNVSIPLDSGTSGDCDSKGDFSFIALDFDTDDGLDVDVRLLFVRSDPNWRMTEVIVDVKAFNTTESTVMNATVVDPTFTVPLGHYLSCEKKRLEIPEASFVFTSISVMQPFATNGEFGVEHPCGGETPPPEVEFNVGLVVGCVLGGMMVLFVTCFVANRVRARKRRGRYYQR